MAAAPLRPLSLGEILDRSVYLTVRNWRAFAALSVVFSLPSVLSLFGNTGQDQITQAAAVLHKVAPHLPLAGAAKTSAVQSNNAFDVLSVVLTGLLLPVMPAALLIAASDAYLGRAVSVRSLLRQSFRLTLRLYALSLIVASIVSVTFAAGILILYATAKLRYAVNSRDFDFILGLFATIWVAVMTGPVALALSFAWLAALREQKKALGALGITLRRLFYRKGLKRSAAYCAVFCVLWYSWYAPLNAGSILILGAAGNIALDEVFSVLVTGIGFAFIASYLVICYYDVRVRREGFDLFQAAALLERIEPGYVHAGAASESTAAPVQSIPSRPLY